MLILLSVGALIVAWSVVAGWFFARTVDADNLLRDRQEAELWFAGQ